MRYFGSSRMMNIAEVIAMVFFTTTHVSVDSDRKRTKESQCNHLPATQCKRPLALTQDDFCRRQRWFLAQSNESSEGNRKRWGSARERANEKNLCAAPAHCCCAGSSAKLWKQTGERGLKETCATWVKSFSNWTRGSADCPLPFSRSGQGGA